MLLLVEFVITVLIVPITLFLPPFGDHGFQALERSVSSFATRRTAAVFAVLAIALLARVLVLPVEPIPHPGFYDEFSYLLMADTFSHGRLTNPTHPMWRHFETFHVNQIPTYCSMYYPAQGLFLAFGQKLLGQPFWGVWLSTGLMCAAFCWALQAWVPPGWAFLGGILAIIRLGTFSYWANSYWGGSVAALGGALVLGALRRIQRNRGARDAVTMGVGLAILGNSRPYESFFYTLPILLALGFSLYKSDASARRQYWHNVVIPASAILLLTVSAMAFYFKRCTGSPLLPPYLVNVRMYETAPLFPWEPLNKISYRDPSMARVELGWAVQEYESARHNPVGNLLFRAVKGGMFFGGPLLILPWFVLAVILPYGVSIGDLGEKPALLMKICLVSIVGLSLPVYFEDHYAAPLCCVLYVLEVQVLRRIYVFDRRGRQVGKFIVRFIVCGCLILFGLRAFSSMLHIRPTHWHADWESGGEPDLDRHAVESRLAREFGKHLVIVHYKPTRSSLSDWVYNSADIDSSKIVWARDMGAQQNAELLDYFSSRKAWLLEPDIIPPRLSSYEGEAKLSEKPARQMLTKVFIPPPKQGN